MRTVPVVLLSAVGSLVPAIAAAAGGGGAHVEAHHDSAAWMTLAFTVVNFSLFVLLMVRVARNPLRDFLAGRRREVEEALASAAEAKEEAERIQREFEAKEAGLEQQREEMIRELKEMAAKDRERALAEARETAERMKNGAQRTAESDLARARRELRAEAARLAAEIAAGRIAGQLGATDRDALLKEFLDELETNA